MELSPKWAAWIAELREEAADPLHLIAVYKTDGGRPYPILPADVTSRTDEELVEFLIHKIEASRNPRAVTQPDCHKETI